ncbi:MAG TPA: tyrosinase family protein [Micromonosporaceae bacterium]
MTVTRRNILTSDEARERFLSGVVMLAQEDAGITASQAMFAVRSRIPRFEMFGIEQPLTVWDLFVLWHVVAMTTSSLPPGRLRNLAHGGPVFLPWHRLFLIRLEQQLQRVTGDANTALPYWDWAADGELSPTEQPETRLWKDILGGSRGDVASGPLAAMRVRLFQQGNRLWSVPPRPLTRDAGTDIATLPKREDVAAALKAHLYDSAPWDGDSDSGLSEQTRGESFRNRVEGWVDPRTPGEQAPPQLHNRVHVWISGDMAPGTSPNDPVFYLNHCNEDRLWEAWMSRNGRNYRPGDTEPNAPSGHRLHDQMYALLGESLTPAQVLDPSQWYEYDDLSL